MISLTPSFNVFSVLKTAHFDCIVFCIDNLSSEVLLEPFPFLNLSNLSRDLSVSLFGISEWVEFGFTNSTALLAAAFPKTIRSISEFEPNLFAPWTDTHAVSPIAINPGTVLSLPFEVNTSAL